MKWGRRWLLSTDIAVAAVGDQMRWARSALWSGNTLRLPLVRQDLHFLAGEQRRQLSSSPETMGDCPTTGPGQKWTCFEWLSAS